MKKYIKKNIVFHPDNETDMALHKSLQALPYGEFSERTKELWNEEMKRREQREKKSSKVETDNNPKRIWRNEQ